MEDYHHYIYIFYIYICNRPPCTPSILIVGQLGSEHEANTRGELGSIHNSLNCYSNTSSLVFLVYIIFLFHLPCIYRSFCRTNTLHLQVLLFLSPLEHPRPRVTLRLNKYIHNGSDRDELCNCVLVMGKIRIHVI